MAALKPSTAKIRKFKKDLRIMSEKRIIQKYLIFGNPFIFSDSEEKYYELKEEIAEFFEISPTQVIMTGSCKLGFSLKPKKTWTHLTEESDIDITIISEILFNRLWKEMIDHKNSIDLLDISDTENKDFHSFLKYFFKGWLCLSLFKFKFPMNDEIFEFKKTLQQKHKRRISFGIFKNEYYFEIYHQKNLNRIKGLEKNDKL